jgi:hypothetical protein
MYPYLGSMTHSIPLLGHAGGVFPVAMLYLGSVLDISPPKIPQFTLSSINDQVIFIN